MIREQISTLVNTMGDVILEDVIKVLGDYDPNKREAWEKEWEKHKLSDIYSDLQTINFDLLEEGY